jgi:uncharacterized tellurite resistance protein B-like protein
MGSRKPNNPAAPCRQALNEAQEERELTLRNYPPDSPQASARILAMALLADGSIDLSELSALARRGTLQRLGISEAAFDDVIHDLCADLLIDNSSPVSGYLVLGRDLLRRLLGDIGDPTLQKKLLRGVLDIVHADGELAGGEAVLLSVAADCWDIDPFDSYRILATPGRRLPSQVRRLRREPTQR